MSEDFEDNDFSFFDLLERFEQMLSDHTSLFFDTEEFEEIINFYLDTGDLKKAKLAIEEARGQFPYENIFLLKHAQYLAATNKEHAAMDILAKIESMEPQNSEVYYTRGTIYSKLDKHQDAIAEFNKAIEYSDDPVEIYMTISYEYQKLADYDSAIQVLLIALELEPDDEDIVNELSFCFEITDRLEEGIETFQKFLISHPWSVQGWFSLGLIYSKYGLYEKSIEAFDFVITIDPSNTAAYFNKANSYYHAEMYKQAIAVYKDVMAMEAPDALTYCYIADCHINLFEPEKAREYFTQALKLDDQLAEGWYGLAVCDGLTGKTRFALRKINKAIKIDPYNPTYFSFRSELHTNLKEYRNAFNDLKRAIELSNNNQDMLIKISQVAEQGSFTDEAVTFLLSTEKTDKWDDFTHLALAYLLRVTGRKNEALVRLQQGLEANPSLKNEILDYFPKMRYFPDVVEYLALNMDGSGQKS